jgi:endonuclease-3 related protein
MPKSSRDPLLPEIYRRLYERYGPQGWWPGDGQQLDVVFGAILTQSAAWANVEKAIHALKESGCWSLEAVHRRPQEELALIIRSCGYFNAKAKKLKAFAGHVARHYGGDLSALLDKPLEPMREELLSIHGIGPETADDILVYAAGQPSFVIDTYTRRIVDRMGLAPEDRKTDYHSYQAMFQDNLPRDVSLFNEYHALLDEHAKVACAKAPRCSGCCLQDICATGQGS